MIDVCDIQVMKPLLASHGFHFSKAKGQNFLIAPWVPRSIAEEAGVDEGAGVLEIGPGIGPLTQQLCLRAGKVCAVEVDERLRPILRDTVGEFSNLEIVWQDVMKLDIPALVREKFPGLIKKAVQTDGLRSSGAGDQEHPPGGEIPLLQLVLDGVLRILVVDIGDLPL